MGALDRVFRGRRGGQERPAAAIVAGLWRNGEQGVWYDPEGFRDAWNSVGQNITPSTAQVFGEASVVSPGVYRIYSSAGAFSSVSAVIAGSAVIGRKYIISFNVDSITTLGSGLSIESVENPTATTIGPKSFLVTAVNTSLHIKRNSACDIQISGLSVKEWTGQSQCVLYQDAAGTLPCYMPGQGQVDPPVGLLLDKRLGLVRGPEVGNADLSTGWDSADPRWSYGPSAVSWIGGDGTTITASKILLPSSHYGKFVELSFSVTNYAGSGNVGPDAGVLSTGPNGTGTLVDTRVSANGTYRFMGYWRGAGKSDGRTIGLLGRGTNSFTISAISVREIQGNHAFQATTTSRPTLTARYNWATFTEDLTASVWQKGTPAFTITPKATLAPDGVSLADIVVSPDSGTPILSHVLAAQAPSVALSFFIKPIANATALSLLFRNNTTATNYDGTTLNTVNGTAGVPAWVVTPAGNGWLKISYTRSVGISVGDQISIYAGATGAAAVPGRMWSVWGLDVRSANDGVGLPPYQRVVDANTYDTAGFPLYLKFDGVDDSLLTAPIDLSAFDKVLLSIAAQKHADFNCVLAEFGNGFSTEGCFGLQLPNSAGAFLAAWGTGSSVYRVGNLPAAPYGAVFSVYLDRAKAAAVDAVELRVNAATVISPGYGTPVPGKWGNNIFYIGRRTNSTLPFKGRLSYLFLRAGQSGAADISKVEKHINSKARAY